MASRSVPRYRVLLVGERGSGKTSVFHRLINDRFSEHYLPTSPKTSSKNRSADDKSPNQTRSNLQSTLLDDSCEANPSWGVFSVKLATGEAVELDILDVPEFESLDQFEILPHGIVFVYDVTDPDSLDALVRKWIPRTSLSSDLPRDISINSSEFGANATGRTELNINEPGATGGKATGNSASGEPVAINRTMGDPEKIPTEEGTPLPDGTRWCTSFPKKFVVGNKIDLMALQTTGVNFDDATETLRESFGIKTMEVSAKWNLNLNEAFTALAEEIRRECRQREMVYGGGNAGSARLVDRMLYRHFDADGLLKEREDEITRMEREAVRNKVLPLGKQKSVGKSKSWPKKKDGSSPLKKQKVDEAADYSSANETQIDSTTMPCQATELKERDGLSPTQIVMLSNRFPLGAPQKGYNPGNELYRIPLTEAHNVWYEANQRMHKNKNKPPSPIYLDYNGTTPVDKEVTMAILPYLTDFWGNPSSTHHFGVEAKRGMQKARSQVGRLVNANNAANEITFFGNGTETINQTFLGCLRNFRNAAKLSGNEKLVGHVITQQTEHVAVLETAKMLEEEFGCRVTYLPVDETGLVDVTLLENCLLANPDTFLVSIMHSNNETGRLQNIEEIGARISRRNGAMYLDTAIRKVEYDKAPGTRVFKRTDIWARVGMPQFYDLNDAKKRIAANKDKEYDLRITDFRGHPHSHVHGTTTPGGSVSPCSSPGGITYKEEKTKKDFQYNGLIRLTHCYFHVDASQSLGKVPVDVQQCRIDYLTIAGHKLYAPKGVGALFQREKNAWLRDATDVAKQIIVSADNEVNSPNKSLMKEMTKLKIDFSVLDNIRNPTLQNIVFDLIESSMANALDPVQVGKTKFLNILNAKVLLPSYLRGAGQESGKRASTENVAYCAGLGRACELAHSNLETAFHNLTSLRNRFEELVLTTRIGGGGDTVIGRVNGLGVPTSTSGCRLPNTASISFYRVDANTLLSELHDDMAASAGAACHSDTVHMSHVLKAMGVHEDWAMGTIRFSVGKYSTMQEVERAAELVLKTVARLQSGVSAPPQFKNYPEQLLTTMATGDLAEAKFQYAPINKERPWEMVGAVHSPLPKPDIVSSSAASAYSPPKSSLKSPKNLGSLDPLNLKSGELVKNPKLTQFTHGLGCACKLRPQVLEKVIAELSVQQEIDPDLLIGIAANAEDACAYKIPNGDSVVVGTLDFFTPIVDDPFTFGQIAAANALSDIYAMGAKPLFALNIVGFPSSRLPLATLSAILDGGLSKCKEAGINVAGGHSVEDIEPKFGLSVTGFVENGSKIWRNNTVIAGDFLFLSKPIGTGVLTTALKRKALESDDMKPVKEELIDTMTGLNMYAYESARALEKDGKIFVTAATDVTGFGLLGHLKEMLTFNKEKPNRNPWKGCKFDKSACAAELAFDSIPFIGGVEVISGLAAQGYLPGGSENNYELVKPYVHSSLSKSQIQLVADAQTSGGLLLSVKMLKGDDQAKISEIEQALGAKMIGRVVPKKQEMGAKNMILR